jgi:hypothetical protein
MDELAAAVGDDPLEFRLKYFDPNDKRGIEMHLTEQTRYPSRCSRVGVAAAKLMSRLVTFEPLKQCHAHAPVVLCEVLLDGRAPRPRAPREASSKP